MHVAPCPEIAPNSFTGEGQVVVSRFTSFDVELLVRLDFDGSQSLTGTSIHRIWSLDRQDWVAMGDLEIGERLQGTSGPVTITSTHLVAQTQNVYNIEVQGEHVYEVTELGILVHNTNDLCKQIKDIQESLLKDPTNKDLLKKQADLNKQLDDLAPKGAAGLKGADLEEYVRKQLGGSGNFKAPNGRDIDGLLPDGRWYEVKSAFNYLFKNGVLDAKRWNEFTSQISSAAAEAAKQGKKYVLLTNVKPPAEVIAWLAKRGIPWELIP